MNRHDKRPHAPKAVASDEIVISAHDIGKQFTTKGGTVDVLRDVNFTIKRGSFTIVFGPSGSGKSTLINVMTGLEQPTSGTVTIAGQDVYQLSADERAHMRARSIGIVHQSNYWIKSLNVLENVALPLFLAGSPKEAALLVAGESLDKVNMAWTAEHMPTTLSGGEQQRISMARALAATPDIIFADEPTGNLDSKNGQMIMDLLHYFQRDFQRTVVLVTHNLEYLPLGDKQLYVKDGSVIESDGHAMPAYIKESIKAQSDLLAIMGKKR